MNVEFHPPTAAATSPITVRARSSAIRFSIWREHRRDIRWYVEQLEEVMIRATADFGVRGKRVEGRHGVWIDTPAGEEKLAALGVHLSRWVTSHGFAYNVSTDLRYFDLIVPCGIPDKRATSLERLLGRAVSAEEVRSRLVDAFRRGFRTAPWSPMSRRDLGDMRLADRRRTHPAQPFATSSSERCRELAGERAMNHAL